MFRSVPATEITETADHVPAADLIPLSHFQLDHPQPPEGWPNFLGVRGIAIRPDHIGRDAISSHDASRLIGEQREAEIRRQKLAKLADEEAVEAGRLRRAQIWQGVPADQLPADVPPVVAMTAAAKAAQPRRTPSQTEWLFGEADEMVFHSLQGAEDEAS
jgi:hypothetical protein